MEVDTTLTNPEFQTVLALLILPGARQFHDASEVYLARCAAVKLKREGHAVVFAETFDDGGKFVDALVLHYLGCRACEQVAAGRQEVENKKEKKDGDKRKPVAASGGVFS